MKFLLILSRRYTNNIEYPEVRAQMPQTKNYILMMMGWIIESDIELMSISDQCDLVGSTAVKSEMQPILDDVQTRDQ